MSDGADDGLSASELRKAYSAGGSLPDSELSAAQLRARYGIQKNEWKRPEDQAGGTSGFFWAGIGGVVVIILLR